MAENQDGTEKSEEASAKRLEDAREKGQVAKSNDVTVGGVLLFGGITLFILGKSMFEQLRSLFSASFSSVGQFDFTDANLQKYIVSLFVNLAEILLPILLIVVVIATACEVSQVGFKIATKKFTEAENWKKPFKIGSGIKRIFFSSRSFVELLKGFMKVLLLGGVAYSVIAGNLEKIVEIVELPIGNVTSTMADVAFEILVKVCGIYVIIATGDFIFQKWKFKQDMKMTKQEVKEENKQMEGDVQVKARLRAMGRNMIRKKMIANVPTADVIIANPTHFAVAISYKQGEHSAPTVVAKGVDYLAIKIKEIAAQNNIAIVEDPPLARTLFKLVDVEKEIPEVLFKAVAQVLAYVYQLKAGKFASYSQSNIDEENINK
jgi:flagellar biosynthetic protein FlhB